MFVNQFFLDLFGYAREEIIGQNCFFLACSGADSEAERFIRTALIADESLNLEVLLGAASGREVWAAQFVSPVYDDQGCVIEHFASIRDITPAVPGE